MPKKLVAVLFGLFLLFGIAHASDCIIETAKSTEFLFEIDVAADGTAAVAIESNIPYSDECAAEKSLDKYNEQTIKCDERVVSDALFRTMDLFVIESTCALRYTESTKSLTIRTTSNVGKIAQKENGYWEIRFKKWLLSESMPETVDMLKIVLPSESKIISFFPQQNGQKTGNTIFWAEIPADPISLRYTMPTPLEQNIFIWAALILAIVAGAALNLKETLQQRREKVKITALKQKEDSLSKQLQELRVSYLKRRVDQQTYQKLAEELTLRLTQTRVKLKKMLQNGQKPAQNREDELLEDIEEIQV